MWLWILIAVIVVIILWVISTYNSFIKLGNTCKESFSTMDVYLKKRWDLIPNLVETVKGYAKHEKETLAEVVSLRSGAYDSMSDDEKLEANKKLSQSVTKIMALAEAYPELKANDNFKDLSNQLSQIEGEIANSRKYYNATTKVYNNKVQMIPTNLVAMIFGFKVRTMFEIDSTERQNVKVKF